MKVIYSPNNFEFELRDQDNKLIDGIKIVIQMTVYKNKNV